jgi:predicted nuclease of predicted toxin-antitoxin system
MKVLIDENLPERLFRDFTRHEAVTVAYMNWKGKENGDLIRAMLEKDIRVLVTLDKNLQYQQNFKQYSVIVMVIHAAKTEYPFIKPMVAAIEKLLDKNPVDGVYMIEQG